MNFSIFYFSFLMVVFAEVVLSFDANKLLALVNQERQRVDAPGLTIDPRLTMAAERHTLYQVAIQKMTHDEPNRSLGQRIDETGYMWTNVGENVAAGFGDEISVMIAWMNSPAHRKNILNPIFTQIGMAYDPRGSYWTQEFGRAITSRKRSPKFQETNKSSS
ncbi:hypothetical protein K7432_016484 [Basidiobolus ranarum]|uniref:SCP domain-containing protein n=1 Tax=Basidiobolus ranarum TaxID=34480 RepID=A0ABR2WEP2_9FUNG